MPGLELTRELLATAKSDLKALANMSDPNAFDDRIFGFHAQQAVEKAVKAWLSILQQSYPFTHDLSLLFHALEEQGIGIETYWDFLDLGSYAVRFRYETTPEDEEPLNGEELVKDITALVKRVEGLLAVD